MAPLNLSKSISITTFILLAVTFFIDDSFMLLGSSFSGFIQAAIKAIPTICRILHLTAGLIIKQKSSYLPGNDFVLGFSKQLQKMPKVSVGTKTVSQICD